MIHSYFSSEDFSPKRLLYAFRKQKLFERDKDYKSEKAKHDARERAKKAISPKQVAKYIESSQKKQHVIKDDVSKKLHAKLDRSDARAAVLNFAKGLGDYSAKGGWKKWNEAFIASSKALGFEGEVGPDQIKAMQRVVFTELGLTGDPSAFVDGKIGPYTRAAMAIYAGKGSEVKIPMSKKNFRLVRARAGREVEGGEILKGGQWQKDGSYEVVTDGEKTYFKQIDGKWMWKGSADTDWVDVSGGEYNDKKKFAHVIKMAQSLSMLGKDPEAEKRRKTVEAAGTLDPNYEWYLVRDDTSPTGYKMEKWKPINKNINMADVEQYNPGTYYMSVGDEKTFDIDGEKVKVKLVKYEGGIKKYSVEGVDGTFEVHAMYQKAIERAKAKRAAKKPGTTPPASETLHPATYNNPYGKPPLGYLEALYSPQQVYNYYASPPGTEVFDIFGPQLPPGWSDNYYSNKLRKAPQPVVEGASAEPAPMPANAQNLDFLTWDPSKPLEENKSKPDAAYPNYYANIFTADPTTTPLGFMMGNMFYGSEQPGYQLTAASEAPPAAVGPPMTHDELHSWAWSNLRSPSDQRPPAPSWMTTEEQLRGYYCNPSQTGSA